MISYWLQRIICLFLSVIKWKRIPGFTRKFRILVKKTFLQELIAHDAGIRINICWAFYNSQSTSVCVNPIWSPSKPMRKYYSHFTNKAQNLCLLWLKLFFSTAIWLTIWEMPNNSCNAIYYTWNVYFQRIYETSKRCCYFW